MSNDKMRDALDALDGLEHLFSSDRDCELAEVIYQALMEPLQSQQPGSEPVDDWLVYCLEYIGAGDPDDIECDSYELYSESDEGQSGTITVSISETCRKAAAALQGHQPSAQVPEGLIYLLQQASEIISDNADDWDARVTHLAIQDSLANYPAVTEYDLEKRLPKWFPEKELEGFNNSFAEGWNDCRRVILAAPSIDQPSMQVPQGWKLVPETPSSAQISAGQNEYMDWDYVCEDKKLSCQDIIGIYRVMLAASPSVAEDK